jgi:hypothetical protein
MNLAQHLIEHAALGIDGKALTPGAIAEAIGYTPANADTAVVSTSIRTVVTLTQAAYDALTPKASDTLYVITG